MPSDYKVKYLDIRAKLIESTDVAYRLGYEQGMKDGQIAAQQAQQQAAEEAAMMQAQQEGGGEMPPEAMGAEGQGGVPEEGGAPMPGEGGGEKSELDEHIEELETLVAKGEKPSVVELRKKVEELTNFRKTEKAKLYKKTKQNNSEQKKFVDGILKKWEKETGDTSSIDEILNYNKEE